MFVFLKLLYLYTPLNKNNEVNYNHNDDNYYDYNCEDENEVNIMQFFMTDQKVNVLLELQHIYKISRLSFNIIIIINLINN